VGDVATYSKEDPLKHLAVLVVLSLGRERELVLGIIVLREVQQDRRGLVDDKVVARLIDEDGDTTIGVQLNEPVLFLNVG
jgi:hypothetical protein